MESGFLQGGWSTEGSTNMIKTHEILGLAMVAAAVILVLHLAGCFTVKKDLTLRCSSPMSNVSKQVPNQWVRA